MLRMMNLVEKAAGVASRQRTPPAEGDSSIRLRSCSLGLSIVQAVQQEIVSSRAGASREEGVAVDDERL